jgi:hypothetical protein
MKQRKNAELLFGILLLCTSILILTFLLFSGVVDNFKDANLDSKNFNNNNNNSISPLRLFCFILTREKHLKTKAQAISDTWALQCDTYKIVTFLTSNQGNFHANTILHPPGLMNDTYNQLTDKVFLTLKYIHVNYPDYDWYLKADDDTFVWVENLRLFLAAKNASLPVTYGYDFKRLVPHGYHSGGAGYVLSRESMHRIGSVLARNYTFCQNTGTEDRDVALCLRQLDVYPNKSLDEFGRERFHPLSAIAHYKGALPEWLFKYASNEIKTVTRSFFSESIGFI